MIRKLLTPLLFALAVFAGWHSACAQMAGERGNGYVDTQRPVNWDSPLNRGLVSWWVVLPDTNRGAVTFRDIAGTNHGTLTLMDPATDWVASTHPVSFGALDFDGSNDRVALPSGNIYRAVGTSTVTVEAVVSMRGTNSFPLIWNTYNNTANGSAGFELRLSSTSGTPQFLVDTVGGDRLSATSGTSILNAGFKHLLGTYDGASIKIFVDGVLAATTATTGSIEYDSLSTSSIGARPDGTIPMNGQIAMVAVRSTPTTDSMAAALYMERMAGNPQTLNWVDYGGEYYEDAAPASGIVPFIITTQRKPTTRDRDRQKFYAAIGLASDQEWGLSP